MTAVVATAWNKPALERHAHVSQALAEILEGAPKAAIALCNYLFRTCIDGKLEEIELYNLLLGANRITRSHQGRPYARNTLREALKILVRLGLVIIDKSYGRGVFRLTINHPGKKRPFERFVTGAVAKNNGEPSNHTSYSYEPTDNPKKGSPLFSRQYSKNSTDRSGNRPTEQKIDQTGGSNDVNPSPITEEINNKAEQAAAGKIYVQEEKETLTNGEDEFLPTQLPELLGKESPQENDSQSQVVNTEADEICTAIRLVMPLNPQIKTEALKYTLTQVTAALALYQERQQKKSIPNPQGFLTDCLRGQWWLESRNNTTMASQYPQELVRWYKDATEAGIVDGRPLHHCPGTSCRGSSVEHLQVVIPIPPEELRPNDIVPFRYLHWREAMALYPLPCVTALPTDEPPYEPKPEELELEATYQMNEDEEPDPEIQRLIQESLGQYETE